MRIGSNLPTQKLRDLNHIKAREAVVIGQALTLDFSRVDAPTFEQRRRMYQQQRQDEFFAAYQIEDVASHVIKPGESLWVLAERTYKVPVWLLRQYNPDLNLDRVMPGVVVKFPKLRMVDSDSAAQPAPAPCRPSRTARTDPRRPAGVIFAAMSPSQSAGDDSTVLAGRTIAVPETRQLDVLAGLLERRGAAVIRCPLVGIRDAPEQPPVIAWLKRRLATPSDDLIVFYTGEGVERLYECARRAGIEADSSPRCAARASSRAARSRGARCASSLSTPSSRRLRRRRTA